MSATQCGRFSPPKRVAVRRCRLDELVVADVAILKVDVEGREVDVLHGATVLLDRRRPALLVECEERHRPGAIREPFDFLAGRVYGGFFILEGRVRPVEEFSSAYQDPAALITAWKGPRRPWPRVSSRGSKGRRAS